MKGKNIKYLITLSLITITGCTTPSIKSKIQGERETITSEEEIVEVYVQPDSLYTLQFEETILENMLKCYDEAFIARDEGNLGLAETKIEEAFIISLQVDINKIEDEFLHLRFKDTLSLLGQEFGLILSESARISEEDPMAWLEEIDTEKFKSGQWTDEELKNIVMKIAIKSDVPIEFNQRVRNAIYYFQNGGKKDFSLWLKRSGRFLPMLQNILEEEGIPRDMAYISMIESGFSPKAYSRARAVGLWQFIYSTGKMYGLDRNQWVDERRDPEKATHAAAKHLNDLYKISDDWNIVMAAYNYGPSRIVSQLKQVENIEYWDLRLPRETQNYVPSFMAAVVIAKEPELFGFDNIEKDPPFEFDSVEVYSFTSLNTIANCSGVSVEEIKILNPEILQDRIPPGEEKYNLRIPKNNTEKFLSAYNNMPIEKYEPPRVTSVTVKRGDTFSGISLRYGVSITRLRSANPQIGNVNKLRIGERINIPGSTTLLAINVSGENTFTYTVRRNDTLGILAERYGTNVRTLQALNNMGSRTRIYTGQNLLILGSQASASQSQTTTTNVSQNNIHTVQKNDTLGILAERYGTSVRSLQALNNMGSQTRIYAGQKLVISGSQTSSNTTNTADLENEKILYVVQKNDTIYEIAQKYGVDYRKIIEINEITNHRRIMPGQKLVIEK